MVMMVSVMMVVMVMMPLVVVLYMAVFCGTELIFCFQLQGGMTDAVYFQLFPDLFLDFVAVTVGAHMHGGVVMLSVHAPKVDVVNIHDTIDMA